MTNVAPYCAIHGYDFSSIVYASGIEPSGGGIGVEEITAPARKYADVRVKGRQPKKYKITARSTDRDEIEAFLSEVNTAPVDSEFYPFEAGRFGLIASAYASIKSPQIWGAGYNFYEAEAFITCREPWLYGVDKGIAYDPVAALPYVSALLENEGQDAAPINYVQASGSYDGIFAVEISAKETGNVAYIVDIDGKTYYSSAGSWVEFGDIAASKISASDGGVVIIGASDGYPYTWSGAAWVLLSSSLVLSDISIADDGTIYGISSGAGKKWSGAAWTDLGGTISRIAAKSSSLLYAIASDSTVWQYDGSWSQVEGTVVDDIAVSNDAVLVSLQDGEAFWWNGAAWTSFGEHDATKIAFSASGYAWSIGPGGDVRYYLGLTTAWYAYSSAYPYNLSVRITLGSDTTAHDRELVLCERMLVDDLFEAGWRKRDVIHSWDADLSKTLAELSLDVHRLTSGGSISGGVLTLNDGDYLMIPFYGPLPVSGEPGNACLEPQVDALTGGGATVWAALKADLSDMAEVVHDDLVVGKNTIYIPDLEGEGLVILGIKAAATGSVSLSGLKGTVKRYMADGEMPWADPTEEFKIRVESEAGPNLAFLEVDYNDRYYY